MAQAKIGDTVKVHYTGKFGDGMVFDTSIDDEPLEFRIGESQVIPGFEEAVVGMNPGETKTVNIPVDKAYGPHRDDLVFLCNGHDMASFASRGEWRSLVLTLKFAEIDLLKEKNGFYPILLLDDVFSELDEKRQKYLFNIIKNTQTFITTTHPEFLDVIDGAKKVYEVGDGIIKM